MPTAMSTSTCWANTLPGIYGHSIGDPAAIDRALNHGWN